MKRREVLALGTLGTLCALPLLALALTQGSAKPFRIYMVTWRGLTDVEKGFKEYLATRKIAVEYIMRDAEQSPQRLAEFVREIHRIKPDLVYTWGTSATLGIVGKYGAGSGFVEDVPTVFTIVAAPVGANLVPNLLSSGRNLTGASHFAPLEVQLAAMRSYKAFKQIGVLFNNAEQNSLAGVRELKALAGRDGFLLHEQAFQRDAAGKPLADGIAERVKALKDAGAEWLYIGSDSYLFTQLALVVEAAHALNLPTFGTTEAVLMSPAGVLAGLVCKYFSVGQFTAYKAEQILVKKIAARDIPIETLKRFSLIIRMETAKKLGNLPPLELFNYAEFI